MFPWLPYAMGAFQPELPQLTALSDPLESDIAVGSGTRPIAGFRFLPTGEIQEATGDTGTALSYSTVGYWLQTGQAPRVSTDWEVQVAITSETGANGTWTAGPFSTYIDTSTTPTFTWTKDSIPQGTATSDVVITLRQKSDTGNVASRSAMTYNAIVSP